MLTSADHIKVNNDQEANTQTSTNQCIPIFVHMMYHYLPLYTNTCNAYQHGMFSYNLNLILILVYSLVCVGMAWYVFSM